MTQMFINPVVVRAIRADGSESFDPAETVEWIILNTETHEILSRNHSTYEEASKWRTSPTQETNNHD